MVHGDGPWLWFIVMVMGYGMGKGRMWLYFAVFVQCSAVCTHAHSSAAMCVNELVSFPFTSTAWQTS